MATEISFPFRVNAAGAIATDSDANVLAQAHVRAVIGTVPGERVMRPDFGLPVREYLFESVSAAERAELNDRLNTALQVNVPDVTFRSLDVTDTNATDPYTQVFSVTYDVRSSNPDSISQTVEAVVSQP